MSGSPEPIAAASRSSRRSSSPSSSPRNRARTARSSPTPSPPGTGPSCSTSRQGRISSSTPAARSAGTAASPLVRWSNRLALVYYRLVDLREAQGVSGRVAEARVDAVGALLGSLRELDTAALQLLVVATNVVGRQEDGPSEALRHQVLHLAGGLLVHHRLARNGHQHDRKVLLPRRADREPAEVVELRQRYVRANLHAELVGVEGERLVLVMNP